MRYRVTEGRVIQGYELKASFVYEAGDIVDEATTPPDHIRRLAEAGVLFPLDERAPAPVLPPPARRRNPS